MSPRVSTASVDIGVLDAHLPGWDYADAYDVALGLDDSHLDFRILVSLSHRRVRCVTVVRRHNALGRTYFAAVRPFHRRLVPYLLVRAARRGWTTDVEPAHGARCTPARFVAEGDS